MKTVIAGAACAALLCACATNPPPAASPAPVKAAAVAPAASGPNATKVSGDPNKVICRRDEAPMASHIPVRNCHTKAEWVEIDKANAADLAQVNRSLSTASGQTAAGSPP